MKKKIKITPRGKQILVKPDGEPSRVSAVGVYKPDNVEQESKAIGTVEAVGPEVKDVKKGDRVVYGAFAGEKLAFNNSDKEVDFILLFDEDVLAFIED
jgi:chaperonin GroES